MQVALQVIIFNLTKAAYRTEELVNMCGGETQSRLELLFIPSCQGCPTFLTPRPREVSYMYLAGNSRPYMQDILSL